MLIALGLLYFVGRAFYNLAKRFEKTGWLYGVLGVGSYFIGSNVGAFVLVLVYEFGFDGLYDESDETMLALMAIPFGAGVCWGFYKLLEHLWSKPKKYESVDDVLDSSLIDQDQNNLN